MAKVLRDMLGRFAPAVLNHARRAYSRFAGKNALSNAELRKEYTRLRNIAEKRLQKIAGTHLEAYEPYQQNKQGFPTLKEIGDDRNLFYRKLHDLIDFVRNKALTTKSGFDEYKKKYIDTARSHGYDVTDENFDSIGDYFKVWREFDVAGMFDSERTMVAAQAAHDKGLSPSEFSELLEAWGRTKNIDNFKITSKRIDNATRKRWNDVLKTARRLYEYGE